MYCDNVYFPVQIVFFYVASVIMQNKGSAEQCSYFNCVYTENFVICCRHVSVDCGISAQCELHSSRWRCITACCVSEMDSVISERTTARATLTLSRSASLPQARLVGPRHAALPLTILSYFPYPLSCSLYLVCLLCPHRSLDYNEGRRWRETAALNSCAVNSQVNLQLQH